MEILIVGNYCHDSLIRSENSGVREKSWVLGGSAAYISFALTAKQIGHQVVAKVGKNFLFSKQVAIAPLVSPTQLTTSFEGTRVIDFGESILPEDLPNGRAKIGIICGVAGEIQPETIQALRERVDFLIADAQGLIRSFDSHGEIVLRKFSQTPFAHQLKLFDLMKASENESHYFGDGDLTAIPFLITRGSKGCWVTDGKKKTLIAAPAVKEIDPTGAGDSFIAGVSLGILKNLPLLEAVALGNEYGAFAVQSVGIPDFSLLS